MHPVWDLHGPCPRVCETRDPGLLGRATGRQTDRTRKACARFFSTAPQRALCIARQKNRPPPSSAALRPVRVQVRPACPLSAQ